MWPRVASVETAQNGFRATGLFPVNRAAIPETAFAPSRCTERQLPSGPAVSVSAEGGPSSTAPAESSSAVSACDQSGVVAVTSQHQLPSGPAVSVSAEGGPSSTAPAASSTGYTSFSNLVEVPHRERGHGRKRAKLPTLLMSSPEHMEFIELKSKSTGKPKGKIAGKQKNVVQKKSDCGKAPKFSDDNGRRSTKDQEKKNAPRGRRKKEQSGLQKNDLVCYLN